LDNFYKLLSFIVINYITQLCYTRNNE